MFPLLEGKVAIVTGAAMGMGEATAVLFARSGARVVVADIDAGGAARTAAAISDSGGEAHCVHVDVSNARQVEAMVAETVAVFGRLDVAVNNAAVSPDDRPAHDFDESYWDRVIAVDLKGVALCQKYELRQLRTQGQGGSIINVSSICGFRPLPHNLAYVAAKHGVVGLTKVAALENGPANIRVNAVAPGAIDTPMLRDSMARKNLNAVALAANFGFMNRLGTADEVAQASLWLASNQSSYVTGAVINVDAGFTCR